MELTGRAPGGYLRALRLEHAGRMLARGATLEAVFERADQALYYAKNHGRDRVCAADDTAPEGFRTMP